MADLSSLLAVLEADPDDVQAREALVGAARNTPADARAARFAAARKVLAARGRPDVVVGLIDAELAATESVDRRVDLLLEKGMVLDDELLDVPGARQAFGDVLALRPGDTMAKEAIAELDVAASNWQKFADKYLKEASASTDRGLATGLYVSAAEAFVRFAPQSAEAETYLRKALEIDPRNAKAAFHLGRHLARGQRWQELAELLDERSNVAASVEEKVSALLTLATIARGQLANPGRADAAIKRVLVLDPAQPQALRTVTDALAQAGNWPALVATYQAALKARRDDDLGMLLQVAMLLWRHLNDMDQAEQYFARVRRIEPAHPAALDFYRAYYPAKGEHQKLLALLRQVEKAVRPRSDSGEYSQANRPIGVEIAQLAEAQNNPEKAIEAWKQHLRQDPSSTEARAALARLYRRTEKWNALLDLMKEETERLPEADVAGRVDRLHQVVEIYRDKLRLPLMVINTYNSILKIDPDEKRASDELAAMFRATGRWNDLIAVLTRKSESPNVPDDEKVTVLREIAELWSERFGNFANAVRPLERIVEIAPKSQLSGDAIQKLKEIYTKRRQWRALIDLLAREAHELPAAEKRAKQSEMARLAAERLGDTRLAIEIHNQVLAEAGHDHGETLAALAALYEREKRYLALAEILHRQRKALTGKEAIVLLEKLGQVYADRLGSAAAAATAWQEVLDIEPNHAKALRTLRELYATAGDFAGLEKLYARLGQQEELVDALLGIADRLEAKAQRLPLVERAAQLAQQRAAGVEGPAATTALERARQVWERVLAIEPTHVGAATALAPIYTKQEKWARLIAVYEIELAAAPDVAARLAKIAQIRQLCEQKLASRTLAFTWTLRAYELEPTNDGLYADVMRLASEPDQWRELAAAFDRQLASGALDEVRRLALLRELAKVATRRLADPERARSYHRRVLELAPDDRDAERDLEEASIQIADWADLLVSYRRRAAREQDPAKKSALLVDVARLQEERLVDLDGAAETYREAWELQPEKLDVMRALGRIEEARGDWEALVEVLDAELQLPHHLAPDGQARFDLLLRLGGLEEQNLENPAGALVYYKQALAVPAASGGVRPQAVAALLRFLLADGPGAKIAPTERVAIARLILPHVEKNLGMYALALEVIRAGEETTAAERLELDRTLMRLYHVDLGDPAAAWQSGLSVLAADPADVDVRASLAVLAGQLGRDGELAQELAKALAVLQQRDAAPGQAGGTLPALPVGGAVAPGVIRVLATELAQLAGSRLGDRATAERAWITVLGVEPDAADAFDALADAYRAEGRWQDLRALLARRTEVVGDVAVRIEALLELATVEEEALGQPAGAVAAFQRVLELEPAHVAAFQALDRLYAASGHWTELEALLARQIDQVAEAEQAELLFRRAELFAQRLDNPTRAVDLLEEVVLRDRGHVGARTLLEQLIALPDHEQRVARLLEPLYEQDRRWTHLVGVLRAQLSRATGTEAIDLLSRIAVADETELGKPGEAFDGWREVLRRDPTHERARTELARLAQPLGRWPEATAALEAAAAAAPEDDLITRAALLGELAAYYDAQLGDAPRAIAAYTRWLEADATNPSTVRRSTTALARLYEDAGDWPELRAIARKQAEWAEEPEERRALLVRVAQLEEEKLLDRQAAIATWRDVLADHPMDAGALQALERLYQATEAWRDLIDVLHRKLDHAAGDEPKQLLGRIAEIHEVMLEEPDEAIAAYLEVLDRDSSDGRALGELARLYREAGRHADLLDVLERQATLDPLSRVERNVEIARLLGGPLARPVEALERWKTVLDDAPENTDAIAAVEAALADPDLRVNAADILRPVYDGTGQFERLATLQMRAAEWADEPAAKLRALGAVARLREYQLDDKAGAFAAFVLALPHAATEPELPDVVAEVERLAEALGREADLIDAYREVAPNVLDAEIQRRLYFDVADLSRAVRRDVDTARAYYQKVLDTQPDDTRALGALESIYRDTDDDEHLAEILLRQADTSGDIDDRVAALVEVAGIFTKLGRPDEAIQAWEHVLATAPERRDAIAALDALYREQGRWPDVVDLYERRLGFATTLEEAIDLRVQLGEIHERQLHDVEGAIDNYAAALSGDPRNARALASVERFLVDPELRGLAAEVLEPIYVAQHRWPDLIRLHEAKLEHATDPAERLRITRFVARLYEEQLEDFESASRWYARLFREEPSDAAIRDQLQRLASMIDNWAFVATTYQGFLDDESNDTEDVREIAIAAATIYDRRLSQVEPAYAAYRRALAISIDDAIPDERELVRRLEELLARAQKWPELVSVYNDVAARADDDLRREVLIKRSRLVEDGLGDQPRAIESWREVVLATEDGGKPAVEHAYREAVSELERLYRARSQWTELVDLFEARLAHSQKPAETAELRLRLAELLEEHVQDLVAAIDQHEHVIAEGMLWERSVVALERLVVHEEHRERIAELLEPVYREQDWWQKLVVILDAKLEYVRDAIDQIQTLHEIAQIHEERDGALDLALEALARAWRIDVADDDSLMKLLSLAQKLRAWNEVVTTLEEGAAAAPNPDLAGGLWARAAEIHEHQRRDRPAAIRAWRKVEETRPDDLVALAALDRLLALEKRTDELVKVVARRAELTDDTGVQLVLLHRVAALYDEVLEEHPQAIAAYRNILAVDDTDLAALDALERLYGASGESRELVTTLERKIELTPELPARQELRHAAAEVYEAKLDDVYQAISQLAAVLDDDAGEERALAGLDRIYAKQKMWPELLEIVDKRALLAHNAQDRAELAFRAARLVEQELTDPDAAIPRHGAVLQVLPAHPGARAALEALMTSDDHVEAATPILERVYRADRDVAGLVRVYERRLAAPSDEAEARAADWAALAEVHESLAGRPDDAFSVWARAITATPEDTDLLAPLVRLAEGTPALWPDLATRLDRLLDMTLSPSISPEAAQLYAMRLGQIGEDKLHDLDRAARAFERASQGPEPRPALLALERVLARAGTWPELALVLHRQAEAADDDVQRAEYLYREGDLAETTLRDAARGVGAYREVLQLVPSHAQARSALERLLQMAPDQRAEIVDILEPLFDGDGDVARLVNVLEARLDITTDPLDRAGLLARIVELTEGKLGDRARALDAAMRWLAVDPGSAQALAEVDRLAERLGQWPEVAMRVGAVVDARDARDREPATQVSLLSFLGRVQAQRLGQLEEATASYRAALALDPEALTALDALIEIHRQRSEHRELADALGRRAKLVTDVAERRAAYAEVAQLRERLGDRDAAIAAWREIADNDDNDRGALDELARIFRATAASAELVDVLGRAARISSSPADEKALRLEIARLESDDRNALHPQRAVQAWQAVVDLDGDDASAIGSLEAAYGRAGDWMAVSDLQMRRLSLATSTADKVAIHAEMASTAEHKRGSVDDAIASWYAALDLDERYARAYDELDRLLTAGNRAHDLVELLERRAQLLAAQDDLRGELAALARAADVWEGPLDNPDAAGEILEKILKREPGSVAALTRLSRIYERAGDWDKCKATLEQALKVVGPGPTGRDAADLFYRLGEVARVGDADVDTAIQHYQHALKHDAAHAGAIGALEKIARDRRDTALLADMLQRRVQTVAAPAERVTLLVEVADLERKAGRIDAALAALARASSDAPNDSRVLGPLADMYFAANRLDEAAPIYDRLAEEAKAGRRMKDVARFRQRQGSILEARGDRAGALAAYEEALRVNPTDVSTMTGLGRLYLDAGDWEKARKIYQSLVLQNIEADAGVTKGEVYWALGKIHLQLGQPPKAKSMFQRGLELEPNNQKLREALQAIP